MSYLVRRSTPHGSRSWLDDRPRPVRPMPAAYSLEPFTAWAKCPHCECFDLHYLRAPDRFDPHDPAFEALNDVQVQEWAAGSGRLPLFHHLIYEVIRTCRGCGNEWGQL